MKRLIFISSLAAALLGATLLLAATPAADERVQTFTSLLARVQKNPGTVSADDVAQLLQLGKDLGRPFAASVAARSYLGQAANPPAPLLRLAAENAELAGDFRTAASRYKQYLRAVPPSPEASTAAARLYQIQVDFLGATDDAFRFMDEFGAGLRQSVAARRFDAWFLNTARERKAYSAVAQRLGLVFADQLPLAQERLWYWDHLEWLMNEIAAARPEQFDALPHCKRLAGLIRNSPRLQARFNFLTANLGFKAIAGMKEPSALANELEPVAVAARAYLDAAPTSETLRDIVSVLGSGNSRFNDTVMTRLLAVRSELFLYAFGKFSDAERETFLARPDVSAALASPAQWADLASRYPASFRKAPVTPSLPFPDAAGDTAMLKKEAEFLRGVPGVRAATINSLAADDRLSWLMQQEAWQLSFTEVYDVYRRLPPDPTGKTLLRFGSEYVSKSPLAMFNLDAARDYINGAWRSTDRSDLATRLHSLDWVPYTADQRKSVFGGAYAEFKTWADGIRAAVDSAKLAKNEAKLKELEAPAAQIVPLADQFKQVLDPAIGDPTKAPTPLCQHLAKVLVATRAKDQAAFLAAARDAYALVRDYETKKTPFGAAALAFLVQARPGAVDVFDLQMEVLAEQLTRYDPNGPRQALRDTMTAILTGRPGWGWGAIPAVNRPQAKILNDVLAKAMLDQLAKGQFNAEVFQWFRGTRRGNGWVDQAAHPEVLAKMIEQKVLLPSDYRVAHAGATGTYLWLVRNEFTTLAKDYPVERYFDPMFVEETRRTKLVDPAFWQYSADEKRLGANVAAEVMQEFENYPFGYSGEKLVYTRPAFWEAQSRALGAEESVRNAMLTKLASWYGKSRFDNYANGQMEPYFLVNAATPEGRKQFFAKTAAYLERAAAAPVRCDPPNFWQLTKLQPPKLEGEELDVLLRVFTSAAPPQWPPNAFQDTLGMLVLDGLRAQKRDRELFALVPHLWKIAKDTGSVGFQRALAQSGNGVIEAGQSDLAAALATVGLDLLGSNLPDDARNALLVLRSKSLSNLGAATIPVERADRRYPVFAAQSAFLSGKPENAWEQYRGNRELLISICKDLDSAFTIWVVEKHTELGEYDDAEAVARALIQWVDSAPQSFDPETRARLLVAFAGIAFSRQEYPRARAQFEQIAVAKEFDGTLAKREAELKTAEVDRITKHYDRAIEQLDKLARRKDPYLQAQANYQLALVKFDQEQYPEARGYLDQVFAVEPTHPNARILEGKLYLKLKKLIEATDVKVGLSASQRSLVPGRPLKVQLEDRNLAVAGKSANIEIRVWTDAGDDETFNLLPFGDSKTKFEGQIPTVLAPAKKDDHVLQVLGADVVHYDYSDRFKQAHKIAAGGMVDIAVVSDAELYVSSGKILSREDQEQRALETLIRARMRTEDSTASTVALSAVRADDEVKPGNKINVRVVDLDESKIPGKNQVTVRVSTSSGDRINSFPLPEKEPYSGVFEGQVPTASAPATAFASDSEEGREPNFAISAGEYPPWVALADNRRPKIFNVDLNSNVALGKLKILANVPGRKLKRFIVQTSLNGKDFASAGAWPVALPAWNGGLQLEVVRYASPNAVPSTIEQFRDYLEVGHAVSGVPKLLVAPAPLSLSWDATVGGKADQLGLTMDGPGSWYIGHLSGAFYVPARQVRTFHLDHKNRLQNVRYFLAIDGQTGRDPYEISRSLSRGVHRLDLYFTAQRRANPEFALLADTPQPPYFAACPPALFDPAQHPEIEPAVGFKPAEIKADDAGGAFDVTFAPNTRARVLRLWLVDFETDAPALQKLTLQSAEGRTVLPPSEDPVKQKNNQVLEIVPGDRITVTYEDARVVSKERQVLESFLTATYHNGALSACFVDSVVDANGNRQPSYIPMRRFKPGDTINVFINDADADTSDAQDTLKFWAQVGDSKPIELTALETEPHSGVFLGKVFPVAGPAQRSSELTVAKGEDVTIGYLDQENTDPGIPWTRTCVVEQTTAQTPVVRVYDARSRALSPEELKAVARGAEARSVEEFIPVTRSVVATRPDEPRRDQPAAGLLGCPLLVELTYPTLVQSALSQAAIYVQTASGRQLYGKPLQGDFDLNVPGTIKLQRAAGDAGAVKPAPGYRDLLVRLNPHAGDALEDGRFLFVVPLRLGDAPDKSRAFESDSPKLTGASSPDLVETTLRVPAVGKHGETVWVDQKVNEPVLTVTGNDEVFIGFQYQDETGTNRWLTQRVVLTGDPFFDVMERRYQEPVEAIHVGESIYFRVMDQTRDVAGPRPEADLRLASSSGTTNTVKLTETFPHSGVFKGSAQLYFAGDPAKHTDAGALAVQYGDTITATYARPGGAEPLVRQVRVHQGANGEVLAFTKRFQDSELAVQTQFTIAEAYFEMAKKHRELQQETLARREIAQGKRLLEEAIRDYPNTESRSQADYLLADLSLEFANDAADADAKKKHYMEAVVRFSDIVASYPDSSYAPKAQFKKALVFEKMGQMDQSCEEYVKLSYRYPDNELVAETIARLGQYFLTKGKEMQDKAKTETNAVEREKGLLQSRDMFKTAAQVFGRLAERFPDHKLSGKTTVLSAQCYMRAEDLPRAIAVFKKLIEEKKAEPEMIAQAMYWSGRCHLDDKDYVNAYRMLKKLTWDYPESTWAKYARGLLAEDQLARVQERDADNSDK